MSENGAGSMEAATAMFERMLVRLRAVDHFAIGRRVLTIVAFAHFNRLLRYTLTGLTVSGYDPAAIQTLPPLLKGEASDLGAEMADVFASVLVPDVLQSRLEETAIYAGRIVSAFPPSVPDRDFGVWFSDRLDDIITAGPMATEVGTPQHIAAFMVSLAQLEAGQSVYDPCCGLGGLLAEAWRAKADLRLIGSEIHPISAALTRLRLHLLGAQAEVRREDALYGHDPEVADRVICDPPLGQYLPVGEGLRPDRARALANRRLDALFLERSIRALGPKGRAVVLVSQGVLSRRGPDEELRQRLIDEGILEAVIALPTGALSWTSVEVALVVLSRQGHRNSVRVLDGAKMRTPRNLRAPQIFASLRDLYAKCDGEVCRDITYARLRKTNHLLPRRLLATPMSRRDPDELRDEAFTLLTRAEQRIPRIDSLFAAVARPDSESSNS